jgi:isocitrate dehydrogenase
VNELDNRGSHFYLVLYWAGELARQKEDGQLARSFAALAEQLEAEEVKIITELNAAQGAPVDIGGYFQPDDTKADAAMRPSETLNRIIGNFDPSA